MSGPTNGSQAPRIAIKFGTASSSSPKPSNGPKKHGPSNLPSSLGKRQRSHAFDHDSDSADDNELGARHEAVTSFGADGAVNEAKRRDVKSSGARGANTPFVIAGHENRDWKSEVKPRRGGKNPLPHKAQTQFDRDLKETDPADQDKQVKWGLSVTKKQASNEAQESGAEANHTDGGTEPAQDADNDAMDALLGKKRSSAENFKIEDSSRSPEQDAYKRGVQEAADISTIEEYDAIPDGEFGAAMLRGMGWNGEERAPKPKEAKRRANLLGLGAKEDEELKKAEMAKKYGHRERRPRLDEYRKNKEDEKRSREDRHTKTYKNERERDRRSHSHDHRNGDRDRDRPSDRDSHRYRDRQHRR